MFLCMCFKEILSASANEAHCRALNLMIAVCLCARPISRTWGQGGGSKYL